jgi:hypothetical protein
VTVRGSVSISVTARLQPLSPSVATSDGESQGKPRPVSRVVYNLVRVAGEWPSLPRSVATAVRLGGGASGTIRYNARRSTRLSLQIPVVVMSLDPARSFREECKTAVVNVHGAASLSTSAWRAKRPYWCNWFQAGRARRRAWLRRPIG